MPTASPTSPGRDRKCRPRKTSPIASEVSGPTTETPNSRRGVSGSVSISVTPPRKCKVIDLTGSP